MLKLIKSKLTAPSFGSIKIHQVEQCHKSILQTVVKMQRVAEITLGPHGRNVLIENERQSPRITKDGITVIKHLQFENKLENSVAKLIQKSVDGTNKYAGDGTTSSTVLIGEIMKQVYKRLAVGDKPKDIRKGFEIGRELSLQFLNSCARKVSDKSQLMDVAMVSTNGKKDIAQLVVNALTNSFSVRIQKSNRSQNQLQYLSGFKFERGLTSVEFSNQGTERVLYNYPLIVTSLSPLKSVKDIIKLLELAKKARKQVVIFASNINDSVQSMLLYNNKKKIVECCCVNLPEYGSKGEEILKRISQMSNSYLFRQFSEDQMQQLDWKHFGKAVKVEVNQFQTTLEVSKSDSRSVEAVIYVGGPNQTVLLENYDHMVDALNSTKTAMQNGVVAGGGVTFWRLAQLLEGYQGEGEQGVRILSKALRQPRKKLMQFIPLENKPLSGKDWEGYDLKNEKTIDMFEAGIVDSLTVAKSVIIDALSLCTVLTEVQVGVASTRKNIEIESLNDLERGYREM